MSLYARARYKLSQLGWFLTRPLTLGVRVLLVRDGRVVLVRHTYRDQWYLPGGGVKKGETLAEAARREAREEVGATLGALELWGAYSTFDEMKSDHVILFLCRDWTIPAGRAGQQDAQHEIERVELFPLDDLPAELSPGTARRLEEYRRGAPPYIARW